MLSLSAFVVFLDGEIEGLDSARELFDQVAVVLFGFLFVREKRLAQRVEFLRQIMALLALLLIQFDELAVQARNPLSLLPFHFLHHLVAEMAFLSENLLQVVLAFGLQFLHFQFGQLDALLVEDSIFFKGRFQLVQLPLLLVEDLGGLVQQPFLLSN